MMTRALLVLCLLGGASGVLLGQTYQPYAVQLAVDAIRTEAARGGVHSQRLSMLADGLEAGAVSLAEAQQVLEVFKSVSGSAGPYGVMQRPQYNPPSLVRPNTQQVPQLDPPARVTQPTSPPSPPVQAPVQPVAQSDPPAPSETNPAPVDPPATPTATPVEPAVSEPELALTGDEPVTVVEPEPAVARPADAAPVIPPEAQGEPAPEEGEAYVSTFLPSTNPSKPDLVILDSGMSSGIETGRHYVVLRGRKQVVRLRVVRADEQMAMGMILAQTWLPGIEPILRPGDLVVPIAR